MTRRRFAFRFAALWVGALGLVSTAEAQSQPGKLARIGVLHPGTNPRAAKHLELLRAGMREHGYVEGKTFTLEVRLGESKYERLPELATELVRAKVDVIVTASTPGTRAAMQATKSVPIVIAVAGDIVASGLIANLARPGGNVTGTTYFDPELAAKRIELLKEAMPRATRVAALMNPDNPQVMGSTLAAVRSAAVSAKVELRQFEARKPADFRGAVSAMKGQDAVAVIDDVLFINNFAAIAAVVTENRLPSVGAREYALAGGMLGYGVDLDAVWPRAAYFVDKILKGARPADIPAERVSKFEFVVNLKTAKQLGVQLPQSILVRADQVVQ